MKINWFASDEEQNEYIHTLWGRHGRSLMVLIIVCCCIIIGKEFWTNHQNKQKAKASIIYMQMMDHLTQGNMAEAKAKQTAVIQQFPKSLYANLAQLLAAKASLEAHQFKQAISLFTTLSTKSTFPLIQDIARIRLARLYIHQHKTQKAIITLRSVQSSGYQALSNYYLADIYVMTHEPNKAKEAYQYALNHLPFSPNAAMQNIITFKLHQLGNAPYDNSNTQKQVSEPLKNKSRDIGAHQ